MRAAWLAASCACTAALAQPVQPLERWLASSEAKAFQDRVVQLALIYGESSGIDPRGLRIVTRRTAETAPGCGRVQVQAFEGGKQVLEEAVEACRH
ncbi:hypothetical protein HHL11_21630 [Ramlibacter sp. G-1-2-2]|uniref:UrcA family protein n=1 Tax=Ramlibacter agri TaxID=2728837 RepID=A0A848H6E6_9BURK|nr:hypothetical protein [Ramlibacter agri]NML46365.1 hypothetical protein [Ramlibacter agri]